MSRVVVDVVKKACAGTKVREVVVGAEVSGRDRWKWTTREVGCRRKWNKLAATRNQSEDGFRAANSTPRWATYT